jgi:hypothetical protein
VSNGLHFANFGMWFTIEFVEMALVDECEAPFWCCECHFGNKLSNN